VIDKGGNGLGSTYGEIGRVKALGGGSRGFLLALKELVKLSKNDGERSLVSVGAGDDRLEAPTLEGPGAWAGLK
jgi:hypothetical protein